MWEKIFQKLTKIYSEDEARFTVDELKQIIKNFKGSLPPERKRGLMDTYRTSSSDIALITYPNTIIDAKGKKASLKVLAEFLKTYNVDEVAPIVHLLPFYPWDTDRGFSVVDYYKVHPDYGDWGDIKNLSKKVKLMFDFVANHASIQNPIVQGALISRHLIKNDKRYKKIAKYKNFVIAYSDKERPLEEKLKKLDRPRATPVLTRYSVIEERNKDLQVILGEPTSGKVIGRGWVWTTISRPKNPDGSESTRQVDLNFANPKVFVEAIKVLLFYIKQGASLIRMDAFGYLWKRLGSTSLHEPEVHLLLQIIHHILSIAAPGVVTSAEVKEPQDKVFEYLGTADAKEADLVEQFTHFTLAVNAVLTGDGEPYKKWLKTLDTVDGRQFIMVAGSHDGMGLKPVHGFLSEAQISKLTLRLRSGQANLSGKNYRALFNYGHLPGGKKIVYEICATPWNLINPPDSNEDFELQLNRYLAVLALGLMVRGIPAIYINGLIGALNYRPPAGLDENRTVNREIFDYIWLKKQLDNPKTQMGVVFGVVMKLLKIRSRESLFNPNYPPTKPIYLDNNAVVGMLLTNPDNKNALLGLVNVSSKKQAVKIDISDYLLIKKPVFDLISEKEYQITKPTLQLYPYQVLWLK